MIDFTLRDLTYFICGITCGLKIARYLCNKILDSWKDLAEHFESRCKYLNTKLGDIYREYDEFRHFHTGTTQCSRCREELNIQFDHEDYDDWKAGASIDQAMPYLSSEEKSFFTNGICEDCQCQIITEKLKENK